MRLALTAAVIAALALAGCGSEDETTTATEPPAAGAGERLCPELGKEGDEAVYRRRAEVLLGLPVAGAEEIAEASGCRLAVAEIDGEPQALTREYDPSRIQVAVEDDEVTEILAFG